MCIFLVRFIPFKQNIYVHLTGSPIDINHGVDTNAHTSLMPFYFHSCLSIPFHSKSFVHIKKNFSPFLFSFLFIFSSFICFFSSRSLFYLFISLFIYLNIYYYFCCCCVLLTHNSETILKTNGSK